VNEDVYLHQIRPIRIFRTRLSAGEAEYCNESVCLSARVSQKHMSKVYQILMPVLCRSLILLWRLCDMLCISDFFLLMTPCLPIIAEAKATNVGHLLKVLAKYIYILFKRCLQLS